MKDYLVALRVGMNDVKALYQLENDRKDKIIPLLIMKGKEKNLIKFIDEWGDYPYMLDFSRFKPDEKDEFITSQDIHNPESTYKNKYNYFDKIKKKNVNIIPVISWKNTKKRRDLVQFSLKLSTEYSNIAIRVNVPFTSQDKEILNSILSALNNLDKVTIIYDFQDITSGDDNKFTSFEDEYNSITEEYGDIKSYLLSTSFPINKPSSGNVCTVACLDLMYQSELLKSNNYLRYGDYGSTNINASMEYIPGMPIIPFASYYANMEWWQERKGGDKEYYHYVSIAQHLKELPVFHGKDHCWATSEIERISLLNPNPDINTTQSNGNNGSWNAIKINQHICAMLDDLDFLYQNNFNYEDIDIE